jgi:hypothetical protein
LSSIDQEEALNALLTKWVLLALELETINNIKKHVIRLMCKPPILQWYHYNGFPIGIVVV